MPTPAQKAMLIDASNLHVGGGVQVASSFIQEFIDARQSGALESLPTVDIEVSEAVAHNLTQDQRAYVSIVNRQPSAAFLWPSSRSDYDVAFKVFGPDYERRRARRLLVGLADPTLVRSVRKTVYGGLRAELRRYLKKRLLRRADLIVVESSDYRDRVCAKLQIDTSRVHVVPNAFSQVFNEPQTWPPLRLPESLSNADLVLVYPARWYPHKNHEYLGRVHALLRERHGLIVKFAVTLGESELAGMSWETREACVPVGHLSVAECASMYDQVDGMFFPSLLEVSSASPLEALAMGLPLLCSDRRFVSEACRGAAWYFDPEEPKSACNAIFDLMSDPDKVRSKVELGRSIASDWPSSSDRMRGYVDLMGRLAAEVGNGESLRPPSTDGVA